MAPAYLAGLVVDGFDDAFSPKPIIGARPAVIAVCRLGKIKAVTGMGIDNKQTGSRVEAGSSIIRHTSFIGSNQAAVACRFLRGIWNRPSLLVDSKRPVHRPERNGQKALSCGAVQHEEITVARTLHDHLPGLAVEVGVDQHG